MLRSIKFDRQAAGGNIKIHNTITYHFLSVHCDWQLLQKVVPQMPLFFCHPFSQHLRIVGHGFIVTSHLFFTRRPLPHLTAAVDDELGAGQLAQTHGAAGVELLGSDADLRALAELAAVGEAGGGVDIDRRRVHFV